MSMHVKITKFKNLIREECVFEGTKFKKANYFSYEKYQSHFENIFLTKKRKEKKGGDMTRRHR